MQIPRRVDYGLRAVIYLAIQDPEKCCSITKIAKQQGVPKTFLKQIIQDLLRCGIIKSKRGACGGYTLARSPGEISFYDVIEAIEDRRPGHRRRALPIEPAALTNSVGNRKTSGRAGARVRHHYSGHESEERD
jgi:Rrf2 family protein